MQIDFTIRHNGKEWTVENERFNTSAPTIDELDINLKTILKNNGLIRKGEKTRVFMAFDNATIPEWIRQYAQHYFNRIVEFEF